MDWTSRGSLSVLAGLNYEIFHLFLNLDWKYFQELSKCIYIDFVLLTMRL